MADLKISQLTGATTPLAGTEVVPLVQSGSTKKVAVSDLTAGRAVTVGSVAVGTTQIVTQGGMWYQTSGGKLVFTPPSSGGFKWNNSSNTVEIASLSDGGALTTADNLVQGTAAKGVNFTANTPAAGMTSQLLNWYEEGTWTPVVRGAATAGTYELATASGQYVRVGNQVTIWCQIVAAAVVTGGGTGYLQITGAPFANANSTAGTVYGAGLDMTNGYTWLVAAPIATSGTTTWYLEECGDGQNPSDFPISGFGVNDTIRFCATYRV